MQTIIYTLSPISDTKIRANAALKPDFAIASISAAGPPLARVTATPPKIPRPTNVATPITARRLASCFSFGLQQKEATQPQKLNPAKSRRPYPSCRVQSFQNFLILLCAQWAKFQKNLHDTTESYKSNSYGHCKTTLSIISFQKIIWANAVCSSDPLSPYRSWMFISHWLLRDWSLNFEGFRGLPLFQWSVGNKDLDNIWALWSWSSTKVFVRSWVVLHTKLSMSIKFSVHAWSYSVEVCTKNIPYRFMWGPTSF